MHAHTHEPVKSKMLLIFLSSASRLTRQERSAPTLLLEATRDREEEGKKDEDEENEYLICLFPVCERSTHLTFLLLQVVIFPSDSLLFPTPLPLTYLRQWRNKSVCL